MVKSIRSRLTIFSITAILSFNDIVYQLSSSSVPETRSIMMYSDPSELAELSLQSNTLGIGTP